MNDFPRPKISIIVPFYNEERFLGKCAETLLAQTTRDIEIIFVNDGSDDNSLDILRSLVEDDPRVTIYSNPNIGVSLSRKYGVERSHGDYVMFVDADDYLTPETCGILYSEMNSSHVDIIHYNSNVIDDIEDHVTDAVRSSSRPFYGELTGEEIIYNCFGSRTYHYMLWSKIFRASIVRAAFEHLPSVYLNYGGDYLAYFLISMRARAYKGLDTPGLYNYRFSNAKTNGRHTTLQTIKAMTVLSSINDTLARAVGDRPNKEFYQELIRAMRAGSLRDVLHRWGWMEDRTDAGKAIDVVCEAFGSLATIQSLAEVYYHGQKLVAVASHTSRFAERYPLKNSRIGVFYPRLRSGGTEVVTALLITLWVNTGYDVVLFADESATADDYDIPENVDRVILPSVNDTAVDTASKRIFEVDRLIRELDVGVVVHSASYTESFLFDVLTVKSCGIPIIGISHTSFACSLAWQSHEVLERKDTFYILDDLVVLSRSDKALWGLFDVVSTYLPNPPPFEIEKLPRSTLKDEIILWVGRVSAEKRVFDALEIFCRVARVIPEAKLWIVGRGDTDGDLDAVALRVRELGIENKVVVHGYFKDTAEFYEMSAVYLSTSAYELFSMTLLESKAYGLPCVMYDLPNLELLSDERGVIRVPQRDIGSAATAIITLLKNYDHRAQMGKDARMSAVDFLSEIDLASAWRSLFNELGPEKAQGTSKSLLERTLRRGLESIFGNYRVGLEWRADHFVPRDSTSSK